MTLVEELDPERPFVPMEVEKTEDGLTIFGYTVLGACWGMIYEDAPTDGKLMFAIQGFEDSSDGSQGLDGNLYQHVEGWTSPLDHADSQWFLGTTVPMPIEDLPRNGYVSKDRIAQFIA